MRRHVDYPLLIITLILLVGFLFIVSSASLAISQKNFGTPYHYLMRQGIAAAIGLAGLLVLQAVPYKAWKKFSLPLLALSLLLVAAVFMPEIGLTAGGGPPRANPKKKHS